MKLESSPENTSVKILGLMNMISLMVLLLLTVSAAPALGQGQVLIVDDDGGSGVDFDNIPDAVNAASDNDVVLVRHGTYSGDWVTIDNKSLTISSDHGATVTLDSIFFRVQNLAAQKKVTFRGLYSSQFVPGYATAFEFLFNDGTIWMEDCDLYGGLITSGNDPLVRAFACDRLVIQRCVLKGLNAGISPGLDPTAAMMIMNTSAYLHDCTLTGGLGIGPHGFYMTHGYPGATVRGGKLYASGGGFYGGTAGAGFGGHGVHLIDGDPEYYHANVTHQGGGGTWPASPGNPLEVSSGFEQELFIPAHSFEATSPHHLGSTVSLTFNGDPGESVILLFNTMPEGQFFLGHNGPLLVGLSSVFLWPLGTIPANGELSFQVQTPGLPGLDFFELYHQALYVPAGGGKAILGPGSFILYLDS